MEISDKDLVIRRVPTHIPNYIKADGSISSCAYQKKRGEDGISVDLERLTTFERACLGDKRYRLLKIQVGIIRHEINDGLNVEHNPQPENDAHCLITGNVTQGKQKSLLKNSTEIVSPF